jgi:hypothetical protein
MPSTTASTGEGERLAATSAAESRSPAAAVSRRFREEPGDFGMFWSVRLNEPMVRRAGGAILPRHEICSNSSLEEAMARRTVTGDALRALIPVVVPLVTKVVLPIAIESLRRGKFDPDEYLKDAGDSLGKGLKKSRAEFEDVKEEVVERGQKLYEEARKQGAELVELLAKKSTEVAEGLVEGMAPRPRRRRFRFVHVLGIAAVAGVVVYLFSRD